MASRLARMGQITDALLIQIEVGDACRDAQGGKPEKLHK